MPPPSKLNKTKNHAGVWVYRGLACPCTYNLYWPYLNKKKMVKRGCVCIVNATILQYVQTLYNKKLHQYWMHTVIIGIIFYTMLSTLSIKSQVLQELQNLESCRMGKSEMSWKKGAGWASGTKAVLGSLRCGALPNLFTAVTLAWLSTVLHRNSSTVGIF